MTAFHNSVYCLSVLLRENLRSGVVWLRTHVFYERNSCHHDVRGACVGEVARGCLARRQLEFCMR